MSKTKKTTKETSMNQNNDDNKSQRENEDKGGDWITQKKTKRKKKGKTVPLKDFIRARGAAGSEDGVQMELIRTSGGGRPVSPSLNLPELSHEENILADSVRTLFVDLLKKSGPLRLESHLIKEEMEKLSPPNKALLDRYPSFAVFLSKSDDVKLVDDLVCHKVDIEKTKNLAIDTIINNVNVVGKNSPTKNVKDANRWNKQVNVISDSSGKQSPSKSTSAFAQMPQAGELRGFGGIGNSSNASNMDPAPNRLRSGSLKDGTTSYQSEIEILTRRLNSLTKCNSDLLSHLQEKEKVIYALKQTVAKLEEKSINYEALKKELLNAQQELFILKSEPNKMMNQDVDRKSDSQIIIELQKQLENEKLSSHSLRHQLEQEKRLFQNTSSGGASGAMGAISSRLDEKSAREESDSLGLKGLISAASSNAMTASSTGPTVDPLNLSRSNLSPSLLGGNAFSNLSLSNLPPPNSKFDDPASTLLPRQAPARPSVLTPGTNPARTSFSNSNVFNFQKLLIELRCYFPKVTESELSNYLSRLSTMHVNISNWSLVDFVQAIQALIKDGP